MKNKNKNILPAPFNFKNMEYEEAELTDKEIEDLRAQGYVVEVADMQRFPEGGEVPNKDKNLTGSRPSSTSKPAEANVDPYKYLSYTNKFESGSKGSKAIGYDSKGGTSYGTIQLASNTGAIQEFINFLNNSKNPKHKEIAKELSKVKNWNTGSTTGKAVNHWNQIVSKYGTDLYKAEKAYADELYTKPVERFIKKEYGLDPSQITDTLKAAVASRAIQHGASGAKDIIRNAWKNGIEGMDEFQLMKSLYDEVGNNVDKYFKSSDEATRQSIKGRMEREPIAVMQSVYGPNFLQEYEAKKEEERILKERQDKMNLLNQIETLPTRQVQVANPFPEQDLAPVDPSLYAAQTPEPTGLQNILKKFTYKNMNETYRFPDGGKISGSLNPSEEGLSPSVNYTGKNVGLNASTFVSPEDYVNYQKNAFVQSFLNARTKRDAMLNLTGSASFNERQNPLYNLNANYNKGGLNINANIQNQKGQPNQYNVSGSYNTNVGKGNLAVNANANAMKGAPINYNYGLNYNLPFGKDSLFYAGLNKGNISGLNANAGIIYRFPDGGKVNDSKPVTYTYPSRPGVRYQRGPSGEWLINIPGKTNGYIPIEDPTGKRTIELNKNAIPAQEEDVKKDQKYHQERFNKMVKEEFKKPSFSDGMNVEDSNEENLVEIIDPTGISSWDDVYRSVQQTGWTSPETGIELFGAIPLMGKFKYLGEAVDALKTFAKTSRQATNAKTVAKTFNALGKYGPATGRATDAIQAYDNWQYGKGGKIEVEREYEEKELTPEMIQWYRDQGFEVEESDD